MLDRLSAKRIEAIEPSLSFRWQARQDRVQRNGLMRFCRQAVEHDLRWAGQELFVEHWESLRDTLQKLERDFGPSDNWK